MIRQIHLDLSSERLVDSKSGKIWATLSSCAIGDDPACWPSEIQADRLIVSCGHAQAELDPMRWMSKGWEAFDDSVRAAIAAAENRGVELLIRPSASGMLSDAISTASWARRMADDDVRLLLDPIGWLTATMLPDAEIHLGRMTDLMSGCGKNAGVLVQVPRLQEYPSSATIGSVLRPLIESTGLLVVPKGSDAGLLDLG